ncbi:UDP-N-acetyl-D-mannosamine dehydrogenase, partial [Pseudidiomarina aestuarii]
EAVEKFESEHGRQPRVACMGLAFKPNIDDLRESPALEVFHELQQKGVYILAVEPNLEEHSSIALTDFNEAAESADIIAYLVSHREFKNLTVNG